MREIVGKGRKALIGRIRKADFRSLCMIVGFYLILESAGITCPILFMTGVSCGGCGMSRAWLSLCRLDLAGAFHYHPLFWLPIPAAFLLLFRDKVPKRWFITLSTAIVLLFLIVYLIRMFEPQDTVVVFCPENGFIYRIVVKLKEIL